ncbi:protein SIEVE ELEMENT OCCLUSION C [Andrographis paniculata]|uniref:protein SIEVE ELEMENT OCCLUSION C n=1 Tax=Andrographis paniculata TaxID=175694 RepID=UPI0021E77E64|nr:protein SIEVE ELEMENT OCCLUSION C [Andrographis paniculata]
MKKSAQPSLSSIKEELLVREITFTHNPDDRYLDAEVLLRLIEAASHPMTMTQKDLESHIDTISTRDIDLTGSEGPLSLVIYNVSNQIVSQCLGQENLHDKTLSLLKALGHHRWDAKVVITLASFVQSFTLFRLISQLKSDNALAAALATFKRIPRAATVLNPRFKAVNKLINTMLKVAKIIIRFEGMSVQHELLDADVLGITKSRIYAATYWIFRSILMCSLQFRYAELDDEQHNSAVRYSDKAVIATWGLHTVGSKLSGLCSGLGEHVDKCQQQIDARLYDKLLSILSKENHGDNQKTLRALFASQNELPVRNSSTGDKCGILELRNKVVMLLISKPNLMPLDKIFLLVQRIHDHPQRKTLEGSYAIVWLPVSSSREWSVEEKCSFEFLSNRLPWFSSRRPWLLNLTVAKYIQREWKFEEEAIMVVLNENGMVSNTNAMDLVWIWGLEAFPFSSSREKEMWEQENWMQDLLVAAGLGAEAVKNQVCICGSADIVWMREFAGMMKKAIKRGGRGRGRGSEVEVIYVGCRKAGEDVKAIIECIEEEELCRSLTLRMVQLFWAKLESIRRRRGRFLVRGEGDDSGSIAAKLAELVEVEENGNWAVVMSRGADVVKLDDDADRLKECCLLQLFPPLWGKKSASSSSSSASSGAEGLLGAVRSALQRRRPPRCCSDHSQASVMPYDHLHEAEAEDEEGMRCGECRRRLDKFVVYKCDGNKE